MDKNNMYRYITLRDVITNSIWTWKSWSKLRKKIRDRLYNENIII